MSERRAIAWDRGVIAVERLGAMLGPAVFALPGGRQVAPLHLAPWADEPGDLAGLLRGLRGEWPCVPFGYTTDPGPETPPAWAAAFAPPEPGEEVHGHGSNHPWEWEAVEEGALRLSIGYPSEHPVRRLAREVRPVPGEAAVDLALTVEAREDCLLPLGLHVTFRLPEAPGGARVDPGPFRVGRTYPGTVEPGAARFAPGRTFERLAAVPARAGGAADAAAVPFAEPVEELLQLDGASGRATLWNRAEGYGARVEWDAAVLPSLLLWFSNRGRTAPPWSGRHLALGMEPACSPFGLGPATARGENPVAADGTPTARAFRAGETLTTRYRLTILPCDGDTP